MADAVSSISFASMVIVGSMYCRYRRCCKECGVLGFTVYDLGFRVSQVLQGVWGLVGLEEPACLVGVVGAVGLSV